VFIVIYLKTKIMATNNIFSLKRAYLLFKRNLCLNSKMYFFAIGAYCMIAFFIAFAHTEHPSTYDPYNLIQFLLFAMFLVGMLFSATIFKEMHNHTKSISFLTLPISNLEKFIVNLFITNILFVFIFTIINYITVTVFIYYIYQKGVIESFYFPPMYDVFFIFTMYFLAINTIYFFAGTVLKKYQYEATSLIVGLVFISIILLHFSIVDNYSPIFDNGLFAASIYPSWVDNNFIDIVILKVTPLMLLITAYFSIKEKEI